MKKGRRESGEKSEVDKILHEERKMDIANNKTDVASYAEREGRIFLTPRRFCRV